MPTRFDRWIRSKLSAITAFTPSKKHALRGPVARRARAVFLAGDDHQGNAFCRVLYGSVIDEHLFAAWDVRRPSAFSAWSKLVPQPDVGKRAAHHNFVIAAARAVGIEVGRLHALFDQVAAPPGVSTGIDPAGEIWSVVTESPSIARRRIAVKVLNRDRWGRPWRRSTADVLM